MLLGAAAGLQAAMEPAIMATSDATVHFFIALFMLSPPRLVCTYKSTLLMVVKGNVFFQQKGG